ncbi:hypothetical protein [Methylibium petroleiphilum]|uniref:hypothetical protein n=1 Tax=Methylibium petroleiphilum TaxID=105560 RepID=UPI001ACCFE3C|nr:hypothetical protein [Methylibium petroleiphilum]MBN9206332.1 hypothetical protein [Methylibium petroleiphilum]
MRTLIFFVCIAIGGVAGLLVAAQDAWSVRAVMVSIGCVAGAAIGGAIGRVGKRARVRRPEALDASFGMGSGPEDRDRNYWRDGGHPPFMRPTRSELDRHMLDPDRVD